MKLLYVYEERIPAKLRKLVRDSIPSRDFVVDDMTYTASTAEACDKMRWAEAVLFAPGRYLSEEVFRAATHIKLMQLWSSGYDKFNVHDARKYGIPVANNGGANAISVAEHTLLLMLAVYKLLPDSHRRTIDGKWQGNSHGMDMFLLHNKTLGLVGFGNIGKEVAKRARGFGMRIIYTDPTRATEAVERELGAEYCERLEDLLSNADIVSLHMHLNEKTAGIIGEKELRMMRPSSVLINVSRAQLVDAVSLVEKLRSGKIWGAGLDVYEKEPTQPGDPLLMHPHVVATPHMAGSTFDTYLVAMKNAVQNFYRVKSGQRPLWIVNGV